jgi:hypothetical protein
VNGTFKVGNLYSPSTYTNTINSYNDIDADNYTTWFNYVGFNGGFTRSRDFYVGDGKGAAIASFIGSTKAATFNGALTVNGAAVFNSTVSGVAATAGGHFVTRDFGDGRFLGISATATNSNALRGKDTTLIAQRDAINTFTQRNTFTRSPIVPDPLNDYDAANYSTVYNTVASNLTTLSDTIQLFPNRPTYTPTQTQTSTLYISAKTGTLNNLNQNIQLTMPNGAFQQAINLKIINGTTLPSGFTITILAPSGYTFFGNASTTSYVMQVDPTGSIADKDQDVSNFINFRIECTTEFKSKRCDCMTFQR